MNKIVREHYPVENLPDDLRALVPGSERVTVALSADEEASSDADRSAGHFTRFFRLRKEHFSSSEEIVAHVRALRDEWDRR